MVSTLHSRSFHPLSVNHTAHSALLFGRRSSCWSYYLTAFREYWSHFLSEIELRHFCPFINISHSGNAFTFAWEGKIDQQMSSDFKWLCLSLSEEVIDSVRRVSAVTLVVSHIPPSDGATTLWRTLCAISKNSPSYQWTCHQKNVYNNLCNRPHDI